MNTSKKIKYILFDAANTLIHKPVLWERISSVLEANGIRISLNTLQYHHKLLSEVICFPDRTSREFYKEFNNELLLSLGIIPDEILLDEIFNACSYLTWERFADTDWLTDANTPIGVLSNFNKGLTQLLTELFGNIFSEVIVSEELSIRKPDIRFYKHAIDIIGLHSDEILYVGDSLKLDVIPAKELGFNVLLIDRMGIFKASDYTIRSLTDIEKLLNIK